MGRKTYNGYHSAWAAAGKHRHHVRTQIGTDDEYTATFCKSAYGVRFRAMTQSKGNPEGISISKQTMALHRCRCVKHDSGKTGQCRCKKCTERRFNQKRFHLMRGEWHRQKRDKMGDDWECPCDGTCAPNSKWRKAGGGLFQYFLWC